MCPESTPGGQLPLVYFNEDSGTEEAYLVAEVENEEAAGREQIADQVRRVVSQGSAIALRHVYLVDSGWLIKTSSGKTARGANREKYLQEKMTQQTG